MSKRFLLLSFLILMFVYSCEQKGINEPDYLIGEKEMVNILYDIHLGETMAGMVLVTEDGDSLEYSSDDFYQAVLDKYQLKDSVLANSILYYSSYPKVYEKIYEQVVDKFNQNQDELKGNTRMTIESTETE